MPDCDLPKQVHSGCLTDKASTHEVGKPPALTPVLNQLRVGDRAPGLQELALLRGHWATSRKIKLLTVTTTTIRWYGQRPTVNWRV
jgi:hypothetical protein